MSHVPSGGQQETPEDLEAQMQDEMAKFLKATSRAEMMSFDQCLKHEEISGWMSQGRVTHDQVSEAWEKSGQQGRARLNFEVGAAFNGTAVVRSLTVFSFASAAHVWDFRNSCIYLMRSSTG